MTLDDLDLFDEGWPPSPPVEPRKCLHPKHLRTHAENGDVTCSCGHVISAAKARQGRLNKNRGNRIQRQRIEALGGRNLAGNNPGWDGTSEMFSFESKSGGFFSERHWRVLDAIPKQGQQTAVLVVTEASGRGRRARSYVVVSFDDWRALHGEKAKP